MPESRFTVYFEDPFWVGMYERIEDDGLSVCKVTFGAEPSDQEIYAFMLENGNKLVFGPAIPAEEKHRSHRNPKRMQRAIAKQMQHPGVGTKAQQALQLARAEGKQARKAKSRAQKLEEQERQFSLRTQKRKEKHRGH